jgi:hypothetical protein
LNALQNAHSGRKVIQELEYRIWGLTSPLQAALSDFLQEAENQIYIGLSIAIFDNIGRSVLLKLFGF